MQANMDRITRHEAEVLADAVDGITRDEAEVLVDAVDVGGLLAGFLVTRIGGDGVDSHEALCKMRTLPKQ